MQVMGVVNDPLDSGPVVFLKIRRIDVDCLLVGCRRRMIVARSDVAMSGHVDQMSDGRRERRKATGTADGLLRMGRRFHGMNLQMVGANVTGSAFEHGLERVQDPRRALFRLPIRLPQLPRMQIHGRVGE